MFKNFFCAVLTFLLTGTVCLAQKEQLHVVHHVFEGGFSINGVDLLYENQDEKSITLGDRFYIENEKTELLINDSYQKIVTLTDPKDGNRRCFTSRIISDKNSFAIVDVERDEKLQLLTLEDGSQYQVEFNPYVYAEPIDLQAGDILTFGGLNHYAVDSTYGHHFFIFHEDGTRHYVDDLSKKEREIWDFYGLRFMQALFFSGPSLEWYYTRERTWHYPYCAFRTCSVSRDGVDIPIPYVTVKGLFKKPNPLFKPNTFRTRWAGDYIVGRTMAGSFYNLIVEFFDFYPGVKFNIDNPDDLKKLMKCDTLTFLKKVNDRTFLFKMPSGEQTTLSLDYKTLAWYEIPD